jgi:hypothetical protein
MSDDFLRSLDGPLGDRSVLQGGQGSIPFRTINVTMAGRMGHPAVHMSDDDQPRPAGPVVLPADSPVFGLPQAMLVRRHPTMAHEQPWQARGVRASARHLARERRIASVPIEEGGGKIFTNRMAASPDEAGGAQLYVLLKYLTAHGEDKRQDGDQLECLADVIVGADPGGPAKLSLILVCPQCKERGMPQGQAQLRIHQSNRHWELDTRKRGEPFLFEGNVYPSAGEVTSERFTCVCGWAARIDKNRVIPDR